MMLPMTNISSKSPGLSEHLESAANERRNLFKDYRVFVRMPDIHLMQEPVRVGIFSWSLDKTKERWLKANSLVNLGFGIQTPMDVVRDYLAWKFPHRLRASGAQVRAIKAHRAPPLYLKTGVLQHGVYVDIKSAYFSIVNTVGWNVDYSPDRWVIPGKPCYDYPLANDPSRLGKASRACLVSVGLNHHVHKWTGTKFTTVQARNHFTNYGLWAIAQDILHSIASVAISLGALYVHTDGYILPQGSDEILREYIAGWGLDTGTKGAGPTLVLGFGNFICGEFRTKRLRAILGRNYRYNYPVSAGWLQQQLSRRVSRNMPTG